MKVWNPFHGCKKFSAGCLHCYMYRIDEAVGRDSTQVVKTGDFALPLKKNRQGAYKLSSSDSPVYTCLSSDFFVEEADAWRGELWEMMKIRSDLSFVIITKRIHRAFSALPPDWGEGYPNVAITVTCENQQAADERLPLLLQLPCVHKEITHEPMLGPIVIEPYLREGKIECVSCGGESGPDARLCDYDWILSTREQCMRAGVAFVFRQTGANFKKGGRCYQIPRSEQHRQAQKAGIDFTPPIFPDPEEQLRRLSRSAFRSRFRLGEKERQYIAVKGLPAIRQHASDFLSARLAPAEPLHDGSQTPMKGHPVFIAQHACACCCRGCLQKWYGIPKGRALSPGELAYLTDLLMCWISGQIKP